MTEAIRGMIGYRLKAYAEIETMDAHPDEDMICAFVEGRLEEAGSSQMVSHLIACGTCRHTTAQLARLGQLDNEAELPPAEEGSSGLPDLLRGFASSLIPSGDDTVFAYQNPPELEAEENETTPEQPAEENDKKTD